MEDISKISQAGRVLPEKPGITPYDKKKKKKKKHNEKAKKHFDELTKIISETHKELEKNDSPFRLCIYQEDDDIFIDIVTIDDSGRTSRVFKHDISHAELENLVQRIKSGCGLILDADA
ncbi:MAG: hypothetical protein GXP56_13685 [Deltaproteobacteria bacterium]|nr:hypothetical protein [Deltaproteobacteria bacterium]